jgi:hypothetical protein
VRQALAGIFDTPGTLPELQLIESLHLDHAPSHRTTALLLVGWLADRLGWKLTATGDQAHFLDSKGKTVTATLKETEGASISRLRLTSESSTFEVAREIGSDLYVTTAEGKALLPVNRMVRAPKEETKEILLAELARGGRHPLYMKAVKAIHDLL